MFLPTQLGRQGRFRLLEHAFLSETNSVDVLMAIHLIEHLYPKEVYKFLAECRRVLKSNGNLFLITPNAISPLRFFLRKRFFFDPTHVSVFSPLLISEYLKSAGFRDPMFRFNIRLLLRKRSPIRDLLLFLLTSSLLAYFRNALHVVAKKAE